MRTVHDFMVTNMEANKGFEEGVALPADDEAGYENIEDGIQLWSPMDDVRRTSRLSRNSDGKEAGLKVRRKFLVAAPKADDDSQQVPMWSVA